MAKEEWASRKLCDLRYILKKKNQELWQDINAVDDPRAYYIPAENMEEARRRSDFVDKMLKKHAKMFNSFHPVSFMVGNLKRHKATLNPNQVEISIPGVQSVKEQISEIDEFIRVLSDTNWYFDEVHHVRKEPF